VTTIGATLGLRARPLVLEITEHDTIEAYRPLREAVQRLGPDVRLAVDDAGAGVANFTHLVELQPAFVKIDASLVRGVNTDLGRQAVVAGPSILQPQPTATSSPKASKPKPNWPP
jgi:EAL domain-containing protein (putative c-di-GMP-specific phosphodiesterase class I)